MKEKNYYVSKDCLNHERAMLNAGTLVALDKKEDQKLLDLGLVKEYDPKTDRLRNETKDTSDSESKVSGLESKVSGLELDVKNAKAAKDTAESKLKARDAEFVEGEDKITPLQEDLKKALADIEKYKAMIRESIGLQKNQKPTGWEE